MSVVIGLLRGVNLGPHRRMKMEDLRKVCSSCKLQDVQTYVQSGNVVFRTGETDLPRLAKRLEGAIERRFGFQSDVVLRTAEEWRDAMARNPFAGRAGIEPAKLHVTFLSSHPAGSLEAIKAGPEEMRLDGRELYIYFPDGAGRSKLTQPVFDRALKVSGTARNWNTVAQLLAIAENLESAG